LEKKIVTSSISSFFSEKETIYLPGSVSYSDPGKLFTFLVPFLILILAWSTLGDTNQYFFLRTVYLRASVETVPSLEYFVYPEIPFSGYLNFLLPILEPSLDLLHLWTSLLPFQSQDCPNFHNFDFESFVKMGRKESEATVETNTSYPGLCRTKITYADEPQLYEKYSIPTSVRLCFDTRNDGAMARKDEHEISVYEDMFEAGFRFPFPKIVRELLHYLQVAPHQLAPNAW
jgi:hypothetical protein